MLDVIFVQIRRTCESFRAYERSNFEFDFVMLQRDVLTFPIPVNVPNPLLDQLVVLTFPVFQNFMVREPFYGFHVLKKRKKSFKSINLRM